MGDAIVIVREGEVVHEGAVLDTDLIRATNQILYMRTWPEHINLAGHLYRRVAYHLEEGHARGGGGGKGKGKGKTKDETNNSDDPEQQYQRALASALRVRGDYSKARVKMLLRSNTRHCSFGQQGAEG